MSATPRPWEVRASSDDDEWGVGVPDEPPGYQSVAQMCWSDDAALIVRAVNAFDALLAVARAVLPALDAAQVDISRDHWTPEPLNGLLDALLALDKVDPTWRS